MLEQIFFFLFLQKMEMVFLNVEIAVVRHLVDVNPHVRTPCNYKAFLPTKLPQNNYNSENEHKTCQLFVIWNRRVVVYNKYSVDILVIQYSSPSLQRTLLYVSLHCRCPLIGGT